MRARMIRVHTTILFPLLFGLIAVAPEFVPWMYGERWTGAAGLTQILAVGGMVAAVGTGTGALLMATGHTRACSGATASAFVAYAIAVLAAVPFGVTAVCVAVVGVRLITSWPSNTRWWSAGSASPSSRPSATTRYQP